MRVHSGGMTAHVMNACLSAVTAIGSHFITSLPARHFCVEALNELLLLRNTLRGGKNLQERGKSGANFYTNVHRQTDRQTHSI